MQPVNGPWIFVIGTITVRQKRRDDDKLISFHRDFLPADRQPAFPIDAVEEYMARSPPLPLVIMELCFGIESNVGNEYIADECGTAVTHHRLPG